VIFEIITNCKAQKRNDNGQYEKLRFRDKHDWRTPMNWKGALSYLIVRTGEKSTWAGAARIADLGTFGNVVPARQAMLDYAGRVDLPTEEPWYGPAARVIEGWFIGSTEYLIEF
jgi:hypothetical protein